MAEGVRKWIGDALRTEVGTTAGRVNLIGMLLVFLASGLAGPIGLLEAIVRVFNPNYTAGQPWLWLLVVFAVFSLMCVWIVGYLEKS